MALGPNFPSDIVRALKTERPSEGSDDDEGFPAQIEPDEDGAQFRGVILRHPSDAGNQDCYLARNASGDLILKDKNASSGNEIPLSVLLGAATVEVFIEQVVASSIVVPPKKTLLLDDPCIELTGGIEIPIDGDVVIL